MASEDGMPNAEQFNIGLQRIAGQCDQNIVFSIEM